MNKIVENDSFTHSKHHIPVGCKEEATDFKIPRPELIQQVVKTESRDFIRGHCVDDFSN
jgi:hypothetical protein